MSKLLFVSRSIDGIDTGATQVTRRNYAFLAQPPMQIIPYWLPINEGSSAILFNTIKGYMSGLNAYHISQIEDIIRSQNISIVFLDNSLLGLAAKKIKSKFPQVRVVTHFHNCEVSYFKQLLLSSKKIWHLFSVITAFKNEKYAVTYSDKLVFLNERDSLKIKNNYKDTKERLVLPVSIEDVGSAALADNWPATDKPILLFVGSLFFPNYHGIKWFVKEVMPNVNARLIIVGKGFEDVKHELSSANVDVIGRVDSLATYYQQAHAVVAPIFKGSGMKTKVAEALMYGKTILGTDEAFEGYNLDFTKVGGKCSTSNDFIKAINNLATNKRFNSYSRQVFEQQYSNQVIKGKLSDFILS